MACEYSSKCPVYEKDRYTCNVKNNYCGNFGPRPDYTSCVIRLIEAYNKDCLLKGLRRGEE